MASRWTPSSSGRSTPSTPVSTCSSPRPPARARRWWPSTRWNGRSRPGAKAFYTTPLKALSNQKYGDLVRVHGTSQVGLLTGDNSINGDAPIVVMTTEVLRNMIYAASPALDGLRWVVLDEVHYLQDRYRGPVWEEVIVHLDASVGLVCLSATVSNAEEVATWIETVRGPTAAVIEEHRPVTLENRYLVGERGRDTLHLLPTFSTQNGQLRPNPDAARLDARATRHAGTRGRPRTSLRTPEPRRDGRAPRRGRHAPRDRVRVQPGRLRPGGAAVPRRRAPPHRPRRARARSARSRRRRRTRSPTPTSRSCATTAGSPGSRPASPRTTRAWCRR